MTNAELIKREDAVKARWHEPSYTDAYNVLTEVRDRIEALPTVDAVPIDFLKQIAEGKRGYYSDFVIEAVKSYRERENHAAD